jgi:hypothetical protein
MDQEAFNHRTEFEKVRAELQAQADSVRRLERQVLGLRASSAVSQVGAFGSSMLSNGLVVVVGCAVLLWWFSMGRSTEAATVAPSAPAPAVVSAPAVAMPPLAVAGTPVYAGPPVRVTAPVRRDARSGSGYYDGPGYDYYGPPVGRCYRTPRGTCF